MSMCNDTGTSYATQTICLVDAALRDLSDIADELKTDTLASLQALQATSEDGVTALEALSYDADTSGIDFVYVAPGVAPDEPDFSSIVPAVPTAPTLGVAPTVGTAPTIPAAYTVGAHSVGTAPSAPAEYNVSAHAVSSGPTLPSAYTPGALPALGDAPTISAAYVVPNADTMLISSTVFDDVFDRASARLSRISVKEERDATYQAASMGLGLPSASLLKRLVHSLARMQRFPRRLWSLQFRKVHGHAKT